MKIAASYLSSKDLRKTLLELNESNVDYIHLDIMDGIFVKNKTIDFETLKKCLEGITKPLDVHLMVNDVKKYVDEYSTLNPEYITFHVETGNTLELINYVKNKGIKVGLSIKPETSIEEIREYFYIIDMVLVMSVEPGYGGSIFQTSALDKINDLKQINEFIVSVDGGINDNIIGSLNSDIAVVGSYITNGNIKENVDKLKSLIN